MSAGWPDLEAEVPALPVPEQRFTARPKVAL
jgi:hypothetical protein